MICSSLVVLLALLGPIKAAASGGNNTCSPSIKTSSGLFTPYFTPSQPQVAQFLDIPYAESPVGALRFAPPSPFVSRNDQPILATGLPAGCFQYVLSPLTQAIGIADQLSLTFQKGDFRNTSEDCLHLSVFAPKNTVKEAAVSTKGKSRNERLPVIVWVHGGGYSFGGNNVPYQLSPNWVQRSQSHIVVQIQYRLNLLGFPNAAGLEEASQNRNLGFLDQRLAVEWVRDNIANFGGDPDRITLWGHSAGAYAADGYSYAWAKDPIVKGIIASSGDAVAMPAYTVDHGDNSVFSTAAKALDCGGLAPADELACMRNVSSSALQTYLQASVGQGGASDNGLSFGTVVDNMTVFADYKTLIAKDGSRFAKDIPLLVGLTTDEGTALIPYNFNGSETATEIPSAYLPVADNFRLNLYCTALQEVQLRASVGAKTFQYFYGGNFTNISPRAWLGAYHGSELPLIFGTYGLEGKPTKFEEQVSHRMQDLFVAFASNPSRGLEAAGWPSAKGGDNGVLLELAVGGKVEQQITASAIREECLQNGWQV